MGSVTTLGVTGMTCAHCVRAVTAELTALPGVTGVEIELRPDAVTPVRVRSTAALPAEAISAALDEAGYALAAPPAVA